MNESVLAEDPVEPIQRRSGQFLTFQLSDDVYAIDIIRIREIIEYANVTPVPMMPDFISGVINLRGAVVPVVDLRARFSGKRSEVSKRTSVIIVELKDSTDVLVIGVVVDAVNEVLEIAAADVEPAPSFGTTIRTDFIDGMGRVDGQFLVLLDMENVLSIDEISKVCTSGAA